MKALAAIGLLFLLAWPCWATNYYICNDGCNTANGTSEDSAWETLAYVETQAFSPGDKILLNRGDVWAEAFTLQHSGALNNPITISSYGGGAKPQLNPALDSKGVASDWVWDAPNNSWKKTGSPYTRKRLFVLNGKHAIGGTLPLPSADGYYYIDEGQSPKIMHISGSSSINPVDRWNTIETLDAYQCLSSNNIDYVNFIGINFSYGASKIIWVTHNSDHLCFLDCCFDMGGAGVVLQSDAHNILIEGCSFSNILQTLNGQGGHGAGIENQGASNVEVSNCVWDGSHDLATDENDWYAGVFYHQEWSAGVPINNKIHHNKIIDFGYIGIYIKDMVTTAGIFDANTEIYKNYIYSHSGLELSENKYGIEIYAWVDTHYPTNINIYQNCIFNSHYGGIYIDRYAGAGVSVWANYLYHCAGTDNRGIAGISALNGSKTYNNTIISHPVGDGGIWLRAETVGGCAKTKIYNNLIVGCGNQTNARGVMGDATNDGGSHNWFFDIPSGMEMSDITLTDSTIGTDPLLIEEHLTIDSLCRDAGISVANVVYPSRDIDGHRVMSDNSTIFPDVGCHEFHIKTTTTAIPEIF